MCTHLARDRTSKGLELRIRLQEAGVAGGGGAVFTHTWKEEVFWLHLLHVRAQSLQLCLTLCNPMDYTVHGILQAIILGIEPRSPTLQSNSLPAEPQGKPSTLVGRFFSTSATWAPRMHMLATKGGGYFPSRTDGETEV